MPTYCDEIKQNLVFFPGKTLREFKEFVMVDDGVQAKITDLRNQVTEFTSKFPMPGFDDH